MGVGGGWVWDETFEADSDLSAYQYHAVMTGSAAKLVKLATGGSGPVPLGILQNDPDVGEEATVRIMGITKAWASVGTAITYGDFLTSASHGHLVLVTASVNYAIALEALSSGSGIIEALWLGSMYCDASTNTP